MNRWLILIPLAFLALKPLQLLCEPDPYGGLVPRVTSQLSGSLSPDAAEMRAKELLSKESGLLGRLGLGVLRRLDDASFWTCLASVLAAGQILRLARLPSTSPIRRSLPLWEILVGVVFFIWFTAYVARMVDTGGTIWWPVRNWEPSSWRYWCVAFIQVTEFGLNVAAVGAVYFASARGLAVAKSCVTTSKFDSDRASLLLTACASTFPVVFLALAAFKLVAGDIGFVDEGSLVFGMKVIGQFIAASFPLIVLSVICVAIWGANRTYKVEFDSHLLALRVS